MSPRSLGRGPWGVLAVAVVAQFGVSIVDQGIPTLTGFLKDDLRLSGFEAGLVVSSFAFGKILGSYAAGVAADKLGERAVLITGGLVAAAFVLAAAAARPLPLFVFLLVLAGMAGAASTPAGGRLVLLAFPKERHGLALGIRQTGIPLGGLAAAALLPSVAHLSSWRWSLVAAAGVTALAVVPLALTRARRVDAIVHPTIHAPGARINRTIKLLTLWGCLLVTGQYAILAFLALDVHHGSKLTLPQASLLVAVANLAGIVGRIAWGAFSDRLLGRGRKPMLLSINLAGLAAAVLLSLVSPSASPLVLGGVATLAGLSLIGYQGLWVTMIAEAAGPVRVGAATGFAVTFVGAAIALSPPLYGLVADVTGTYRSIWIVLSGVLVLALVPALLLEEGPAPGPTPR